MKKNIFLFLFILSFSGSIFSQTVYKTETGQYYHRATCKKVSKSTPSMDLSKALMMGHPPCKECKPPTKEVKKSAPKPAAKPQKQQEKKPITSPSSEKKN